jgi:hypothetical protein
MPSAGGDATSGSHTALPGFESPAALSAGPGSAGHEERGAGRPRLGARLAPGGRPLAWAAWAAVAVALVAAGTGLGMALRGSGGPPPGPGPGQGAPPSSCTTPAVSSTPQLCVTQPLGDGNTVFVIHGSGFPPFTPVTIQVMGVASSDHPVADLQGTFNYAIDQGHRFFPGPIPPGNYSVVVTGSGGRSARTSFLVNPPGPPRPPPS